MYLEIGRIIAIRCLLIIQQQMEARKAHTAVFRIPHHRIVRNTDYQHMHL